jgi:hypothetical protein
VNSLTDNCDAGLSNGKTSGAVAIVINANRGASFDDNLLVQNSPPDFDITSDSAVVKNDRIRDSRT